MKPHLINANSLQIPLPDESVDMCVTSPPYYGLRDYQVEGQLGLEETPEQYVENMVAVFREVWRVMKPHGTLWLNIGDSYASSTKGSGGTNGNLNTPTGNNAPAYLEEPRKFDLGKAGLKPKDLIGIPWMLAFALRADGWYLRSDIIWSKPNPMPESVRDRPTKAHEYLFLLSKSRQYYYDADAIREASVDPVGSSKRYESEFFVGDKHESGGYSANGAKHTAGMKSFDGGRNKRTVWEITTKPYSGAHFATFPPDLVEPCIKAGSSEHGVCPECGNPWERVVDYKADYGKRQDRQQPNGVMAQVDSSDWRPPKREFVGWHPTCDHDLDPIPAIVIDPFAGSGTTLMVARQLGRDSIGIELSREYIKLAEERLALKGNWWDGAKQAENNVEGLPMFDTEATWEN